MTSLVECAKDPATGEYPEEPVGDFKIDEKGKRVTFTDEGMNHIEELLVGARIISGSLFTDENFEHLHYVTQSLRAHKLFHKDVDYVVQDGQVQIVDEFTGRILHGRRYSEGLHQAIEAKERIKIAQRNRTLATITFQNYFRMYGKLAGMTGTADTEAQEFGRIYTPRGGRHPDEPARGAHGQRRRHLPDRGRQARGHLRRDRGAATRRASPCSWARSRSRSRSACRGCSWAGASATRC